MKKIIIAGTGSGVGKTTISIGIMKALIDRGKSVQAFKIGPDYIDPSFHEYVTGRSSRNLDSYMLDDEQVKYVYRQASKRADISIIEGVMGLYDGLGTDINKHSTSKMAKTLKAPVILVVDAKAMGSSVAAMVLGYKQLDKDVEIVGVIANNVRTKRHFDIVKTSIEKYCALEVLGYIPPLEDIRLESRQLGLVPSGETEYIERKIDILGKLLEDYVDIDRIIEQMVTALKLPNTHIADRAGKMMSADIKSEPTRFIPSTIITAMMIAMIKLYVSVLVPVAFAYSSSNVTAKSLLYRNTKETITIAEITRHRITSSVVSVNIDVEPNNVVHTSPDTFADDENTFIIR